ncbi:MAG: AhpC/TSA family protein [Bacteroidales bacterium]|nr:AhpC/TSA family protein [Bacteroidales bacterium]
MRISQSLAIIGVASLLASCHNDALTVEGTLKSVDDGFIYLSAINNDMQWQHIDTTRVNEGSFKFETADIHEGGECFMITTPHQQQMIFFAGKDNVSIEGNLDMPSSIKVSGTDLNEIYEQFVANVPEQDRLQKLNRDLQNASYNIDKANAIKEEIYNAQMEQLAYIKRFVSNNLDNPVGAFVLINSVNYFSFEEADNFSKSITAKLPNHKYSRIFESIVDNRRTIYEAMQRVEIGQPAPDFTLPDVNDKDVTLSDLKGKNVLLYFWASNDRLSRINNPAIRELYQKFSSKPLTIVSISVDQNANTWRSTIKEDQLPGIQLLDADNEIAATYCVPRLPFAILIDFDGKIVAKDHNAESVFSDVETLLSK